MPSYEVTSPDGRSWVVDAPEGATQDQILAYARSKIPTAKPSEPQYVSLAPTPPSGGFFPALARGAIQTQSLIADVIPAMIGRAIGADEYAEQQWKEAAEKQKLIEQKYAAAVPSYKDIKGVGDLITYVTESVGELVPSIIPSIFTGGTASVLGRGAVIAAKEAAEVAARKAVTQGATAEAIEAAAKDAGIKAAQRMALKYEAAGALAGSASQNIPDVYQNIKKETGKESLGAALMFGGFNSLLDAALPISTLAKLRKAGVPGEEVMGEWYKRFGKGAVKGFATEGATEAAQEMSSAAAEKFVDQNKDFFTEKNLERFLNAGLKGGLGGGVFGGTTDVALGKRPPTQDELVKDLRPGETLEQGIYRTANDLNTQLNYLKTLRAEHAEEGKTVLTPEALKDMGFKQDDPLYVAIVDKDLNNPAESQDVLSLFKSALKDPKATDNQKTLYADALSLIEGYVSQGEPSAQAVTQPSGTSAPMAGVPSMRATAERLGGAEPTGVAGAPEVTGQPAVGETAAPAPVAPPQAPAVPTRADVIQQQEERLGQLTDQFQRLLQEQVKRYGLGNVGVNVVDDLKNANGQYSKGLIKMAIDANDPVRDLRHESIHALKELGFFSDAQWNTLVRMANERWVDQHLKGVDVNGNALEEGQQSRHDAYVDLYRKSGMSDAQIQEALVEEAIADAFGGFAATKPPPGFLNAILNRMRNFFRAVKESVGIMPPETAERIFGKIEQGKLAAKQKVAPETAKVETAKPSLTAKPKLITEAAKTSENLRGMISDETLNKVQNVLNTYTEKPSNLSVTPEQRAKAEKALAPFYAKAEQIKPKFDSQLRDIAEQLGGNARIPGIKGIGRAAEKLALETRDGLYGKPNGADIKDILRGTIVVKSEADIQPAIDLISKSFPEVTRFKNRFKTPQDTGYRDVLMNVKLDNGLDVEIQVNIPEMITAKTSGHPLYVMSRNLEDGDPEKAKLDQLSRDLYNEAYRFSQKAISPESAGSALTKTSRGTGIKGGIAKTTEPSLSSKTGSASKAQTLAPSGIENIGVTSEAPSVAERGERASLREVTSPLEPYVTPEEAEGRVRRRLARLAGVGTPSNEKTSFTKDGVIFSVGKITPKDWLSRVNQLMSPQEVMDSRNWYQQLHDELVPIYGEKASIYALAWLLSQKRASPSKGMTDVLRAADIAAGKKKVIGAGLNEKALIDVIQGNIPNVGIGAKLMDFVDSELGKTTRTIVRGAKEGRQPAAIDVWAERDIGFVDPTVQEYIRKVFGDEAADSVKVDKTTAGEAQYEYGIDFYNDTAEMLNKMKFMGGGWTAREVQAVGWVTMQKAMGIKAEFVKDIIGKNTRRVSIGLAPGEGSPMAGMLAGKEIPPQAARAVVENLAKMSGIKVQKNIKGVGAYLTYVEGSIQVDALASPEAVADFMDMLGYVFQQTEIINTRPLASGSNMAVDIMSSDLNTEDKAVAFFKTLLEASPTAKDGGPMFPGFQQITVDGVPGIRLLNFEGKWKQKQIEKLKLALDKVSTASNIKYDDIVVMNVVLSRTKNDWTENPNGSAYLDSLRNRGRLQEAERLQREFPPSRFDLAGEDTISWTRGEREERREPGEVERLSIRAPKTDEFERFFEGSKAKDEEGNPLLYYRGAVREPNLRNPKSAGAIFFSPNPAFAEGYVQYKLKELAETPGDFLSAAEIRNAVRQLRQYVYDTYGRQSKTAKDLLSEITEVEDQGKRTGVYKFRGELGDIWRGDESNFGLLERKMQTGRNLAPVFISVKNPFDYEDKKQVAKVINKLTTSDLAGDKMEKLGLFKSGQTFEDQEKIIKDYYRDKIASGDWRIIETPEVQQAIRDLKHDGFYAAEEHTEGATKNLAVYNRNQVKSAVGNVGAYGQRAVTEEEAKGAGFTKEEAAKVQEEGDIRFSLRKAKEESGPFNIDPNSKEKPFNEWPRMEEPGGFQAKPGDYITVIRLAGFEGLNNTNAASTRGLAAFLSDVDDWEKPAIQGIENSDTVYAYKVKVPKDGFGKYVPIRQGKISSFEKNEKAGRMEHRYGGYWYSFPDGTNAEVIGVVKLSDIRAEAIKLDSDTSALRGNFDNIGNELGSQAIDAAFSKSGQPIRYSLRNQVGPNITRRMLQTTTVREQKGFVERITGALKDPEARSKFRAQVLNRYNRLSEYDKIKLERAGGMDLYADITAEGAALQSDLAAGILASAFGVHDKVGGVPVYVKTYIVQKRIAGPNGLDSFTQIRAPGGAGFDNLADAQATAQKFGGEVREAGYMSVSNKDGTVKGPISIFAPLAKYNDPDVYRLYQLWAGIKRGSKYMSVQQPDGSYIVKEQLFNDPNDAAYAKQLEKQFPEFKSIQEEWIKYNDGLIDMMRDAGVISAERAKIYKQHGDYIPFYRQINGAEDAVGPRIFQSIGNVQAPKKLKHGADPLGDFLENVVRNSEAAIQASVKNIAARRAADVGMDVGTVAKLGTASNDPNAFYVMENGEKVYYNSSDILFTEAIKSLGLPNVPFIGLLASPANVLRNLVTKDPGFMLANMMRDSLAAWGTTDIKMTPFASTLVNFGKALANKSPELRALQGYGALGGYDYSQNVKDSAAQFEKELRKKAGAATAKEKALRPVTYIWEALEKGTEASDAATRIEVYKKTLEKTGNEAEALFRALEVMNFNRKGANPIVRVATAAIPFLNARMQGLDVLYRAGFGENATKSAKDIQKAFFVRGATMMALSAMYWLLTHDDDDYKKQEQETRDNNWLIPSLGVKVPIPFELGILFKVIPERILELTFGQDTAKDFTQSMARQLSSTLAFNPIPQAALPIVEYMTNYSFFTGRPIVGMGMENVAPAYQVGPGTSKAAQLVGEATKGLPSYLQLSPMKIDQLINGYTGTMGMYMVDLMDSVYDMHSDSPKPSKRFEQLPVFKRFVVDPEARGQVTSYYDLKNSVDEATRTENLLQRSMKFEEYGEYMKDNIKMFAVKSYVLDLEKTMKQYNEMKLMIRNSKMDADAKRDALLNIQRAENQLTANIQALKKKID